MKFTPIDLILPSIADEATSDRERSKDTAHVSECIKYLLMQMDPKRYGSTPDDGVRLLWELGLGFEDLALSRYFWRRVLKRKYPTAHFKQVQVCVDRIWGTCDMLALDEATTIVESKLTRISAINEIEGVRFWSWRVQMMAYCKMWKTRRALIPVCFLDGDYRPRRMMLRAWDAKFKQSEIDENWNMLLDARDAVIAARKKARKK